MTPPRGPELTDRLDGLLGALGFLACALTISESPTAAASPLLLLSGAYLAGLTLGHPAALRRHWTPGYLAAQLLLTVLICVVGTVGTGTTLLMLLVISQGARTLPLGWMLGACLLLPAVHLGMRPADLLREGVGLWVAAAFVVATTRVAVREAQLRAEKETLAAQLAEANAQLRSAAAQGEELATMRERTRIARDIHDGLGHHLTAAHMQVQAAHATLTPDPHAAARALEHAQDLTREALAEVRRAVSALRGPDLPLPDALGALVRTAQDGGLAAQLRVQGEVRPLGGSSGETLYRVVQEALTNVRRHAHATTVTVTLTYLPGQVEVQVRDDGRGCDAPLGGFGLPGLRERMAALGGDLRLDTAPGAGFTVTAQVPA